ncbi:MAG: hypothetical protein HY939_08160 [Gammaproteobacteria bacterium]|nr:hypothetical protein [Gammaproteobacteria bacterium]
MRPGPNDSIAVLATLSQTSPVVNSPAEWSELEKEGRVTPLSLNTRTSLSDSPTSETPPSSPEPSSRLTPIALERVTSETAVRPKPVKPILKSCPPVNSPSEPINLVRRSPRELAFSACEMARDILSTRKFNISYYGQECADLYFSLHRIFHFTQLYLPHVLKDRKERAILSEKMRLVVEWISPTSARNGGRPGNLLVGKEVLQDALCVLQAYCHRKRLSAGELLTVQQDIAAIAREKGMEPVFNPPISFFAKRPTQQQAIKQGEFPLPRRRICCILL